VTTCCYCHLAGATFRVNADERAHRSCAWDADDADQATTLSLLHSEPSAPDEIEYLRAAPRKPPQRADHPKSQTRAA